MSLLEKIEELKKDNNIELLLSLENIVNEIKLIDENIFLKYYDNTLKILENDLENIKNKIEINKTIFINNIKILFYLNEINEILMKETLSFLSDNMDNIQLSETLKTINIIQEQDKEIYELQKNLFKQIGIDMNNLDLNMFNELIFTLKSIKTKK